MLRRGCGSTKRRSFTRSSRTSTSIATSGSNVTPWPLATICKEVGRPELVMGVVALAAIDQRLIAQTVAFFQQQQLARIDVARADHGAFRQGIVGRHGQQEPVAEQDDRFELGLLEREGQEEHVQRPSSKFAQQRLGLGFEKIETQVRWLRWSSGSSRGST